MMPRGLVSSVETGQFNTTTYAASYAGDGAMVYESKHYIAWHFRVTSYIVRSSVLGGDVLTRLDQSGNKKITHVPAEGLLFATQRASGGPGAYVQLTYRDPLGITETTKAVYDPLGNYTPFQAYSRSTTTCRQLYFCFDVGTFVQSKRITIVR